jgi:hypothetical protein
MATKNVSNAQQLVSALQGASGGDRIVLAAGNYGNVSLTGHDFNGTVTVSGAGRASFTGLALRDVENLTLDSVSFDYVPGRSASSRIPFTVTDSKNVTIRNADFDGHLSGGYGTSLGLRVMDSSGITVENSDFAKFQRGAYFTGVTDLVVRGNDMRLMSEDVLEFAQVIDARIERNHLHDMETPPARMHKDLIQFWSAGTSKPSADIVIQDNVLESDEPLVHGIYLGNEIGRYNKSFKYQNIQILDNKITSGHVMGIDVEHASNVIIRGNDLRIHPAVPKKPINTPGIEVSPDSTKVVISGNSTSGRPIEVDSGWSAGRPGSGPAPEPAPGPSVGGGDGGGSGGGSNYSAVMPSGDRTSVLRGVDLDDGDRILLKSFDAGTLKGLGGGNPLAVNKAGTYAVLDSLADIRELDLASAAVTTRTLAKSDTLVVDIDPRGPGSLELHLHGHGQDFLAL